jgi:hypothetical protein
MSREFSLGVGTASSTTNSYQQFTFPWTTPATWRLTSPAASAETLSVPVAASSATTRPEARRRLAALRSRAQLRLASNSDLSGSAKEESERAREDEPIRNSQARSQAWMS